MSGARQTPLSPQERASQRAAKVQMERDVRDVMSTPSGRRFVWWLIQGVAQVHGRSYTGGSNDTFFNEGRRFVGIRLMETVQTVAPSDWVYMVQESFSAAEAARAQREAEQASETD